MPPSKRATDVAALARVSKSEARAIVHVVASSWVAIDTDSTWVRAYGPAGMQFQGQQQPANMAGYRAQGLVVALMQLALPYAHHPDYCEEWRP